jgi:hypothetical protein
LKTNNTFIIVRRDEHPQGGVQECRRYRFTLKEYK